MATKRRTDVVLHGHLLRDIRVQRGMSQEAFAVLVGVSRSFIAVAERDGAKPTYASKAGAIANKLGVPVDEILVSDPEGMDEWDANVEPYHQQHIPHEIPTFDLPVAAGGWSVVTDNHTGGITCTSEQRRQGLFRVTIRGDSMTPRFVDGDLVEFKLLCAADGSPDFEKMREGEAYYVQKHDGEGTFKICRKIEPDHIELVAINKHYKKPLIAILEEIVSVGRFEYKLSK